MKQILMHIARFVIGLKQLSIMMVEKVLDN